MKPPLSLWLVTLAGSVLGAGQAWTGLMLRLFPSTPSPFGPWGLASGAGPRLVVHAQGLSWPLIAAGCAWLGVVLGLWLHLGWVRRVGIVLSVFSAMALGPGLLLTLLGLACLLSPSLGRWLAWGPSSDG